MFNITILAIGTLKENYLREAFNEYIKRIKPYAKLDVIELPETTFSSINERENVKAKEAEVILKKIKKNSVIFLLTHEGKQYSSEEFAQLIYKSSNGTTGNTHITFVIGGALGLHDSIKKSFRNLLSFSKMTFTHQMARIILVEQLYRAGTIINNKQYHY